MNVHFIQGLRMFLPRGLLCLHGFGRSTFRVLPVIDFLAIPKVMNWIPACVGMASYLALIEEDEELKVLKGCRGAFRYTSTKSKKERVSKIPGYPMTDRPYTPIACGLHENYQYAVMKKAELDLRWRDVEDLIREARVMPVDVFTREGAEYLQAEADDGCVYTIRLDCIETAHWASDGQSLNPIR